MKIPQHLQKYLIEQSETKYTPVHQATWRYILRQLRDFLKDHAHESYISGLEQTGISIDRIPSIANISKHLEAFGWQARPVSGFIPPAAFMELQALGILPIASDMRTIEHLQYTPAPDIVHEAAGHAPLLANREYANYLAEYAQVARKAIINSQDMELYKAIRYISDLKENPSSTPAQIQAADQALQTATKNLGEPSETALLGRMNWWTAEYGLIGSLKNPKIFGAGLLSSIGESKWCLSDKVKKIPLSIDCVNYSYDITEPQPQLFVTEHFDNLKSVLNEFKQRMSYTVGGSSSVQKAIHSKTVNTVELDNGLQISGTCEQIFTVHPNSATVILDQTSTQYEKIIFIKFSGPTQISYQNHELVGHSKNRHSHGFSSPLGAYQGSTHPRIGQALKLQYSSGIQVEGELTHMLERDGKSLIWTFKNCTVKLQDKILFDPSWGEFDLIFGNKVTSVFGGPADREAYGEVEDFIVAKIPEKKFSPSEIEVHNIYARIRQERDTLLLKTKDHLAILTSLVEDILKNHSQEWLALVELLEITGKYPLLHQKVDQALQSILDKNPNLKELIEDGRRLSTDVHT